MEQTIGDFAWALSRMKAGAKVFRRGWNNSSIKVFVQFPDENSANTEQYLVMEKGSKNENNYKRFPLDLSCESIFAEDWEEVID